MADTTTFFPRRLILGGAVVSGVLLALAVHMLGARYGLDLRGPWRSGTRDFMPAGAGIPPGAVGPGRVFGRLFHRQPDGQRRVRPDPAAHAPVPDRDRRADPRRRRSGRLGAEPA